MYILHVFLQFLRETNMFNLVDTEATVTNTSDDKCVSFFFGFLWDVLPEVRVRLCHLADRLLDGDARNKLGHDHFYLHVALFSRW